ncbi:sigma-70 family RNA polymerase sigma factor [Armatimonas rosea]|uniref:RNA polymerase sigma-70 factor (ECF subfamily) n=1 Tax=Armatimonas rosea TaxID=685828 RepID=A0A7W9SNW1_ARMRO|nr:sigma-70 family RNA polymerase sigma factor [Armatimonas rosea]MBB6049780.1 RNA polymerase sigma-70 factor (ECF subfamily) [Armatimonas rosea]
MAESEALTVESPSFGGNAGGVFERLMQRHRKQAYHVAYRMTGNHADAEDLLQEAFVRAFRFFDNYRRDLPFEKWLFRIMSNLFVDGVRKKNRMRTTSLDAPLTGEAESNLFLDIPDARTEPERVTLHEELDEQIQRALASLPADFRKTVILADIEQLSYEEISKLTGCTIGTVRSRLHRGRKLLRARLEGFSLR